MNAKKNSGFVKRGISQSVVFRILLICISFVILPMIIHAFLMYAYYYKEKILDRMTEIEIIGEADHYIDVTWVEFMKDGLDALSRIPPTDKKYHEVAEKGNYTAIYYLVKNSEGDYVCTVSDNKKRIGPIDPLFEPFTTMTPHSFKFMGAFDPLTKKPFDFVAYANAKGDVYILAQSIKEWVSAEKSHLTLKRTFDLSVVNDKGVVLYSTNPNFSLENIEVVPFEKFRKSRKKLSETKKEFIGGTQQSLETNYSLYITFSRADLSSDILNRVIVHMLLFSVIIIVIGGGVVLFIAKKLQKPLTELYQAMRSVKEGDLNVRYKPQLVGFEINSVGEYFNATVEHLVSHMKQEQEERIQKGKLQTQLTIASDIQMSLFPEELPSFPSLDIASSFMPAKIMSGDFFDFFPFEDQLLFLVADASGKGIPSALYSLAVRNFVRSICRVKSDLSTVIQMSNQLLCEDTKEKGDFVTVWFGMYDRNTQTLKYNSSGHNPAFLKRSDGTIEELTTPGIAFGVQQIETVKIKEVSFRKGDQILVYTDGLTDAQNTQEEFFGKNRVLNLLQSRSFDTSDALLSNLVGEVKEFSQGADLFDDMTLLAITHL